MLGDKCIIRFTECCRAGQPVLPALSVHLSKLSKLTSNLMFSLRLIVNLGRTDLAMFAANLNHLLHHHKTA